MWNMAMTNKCRPRILLGLVAAPAFAVTITFTGVSGSPGDVSFDGPLAGQGIIVATTGGPAVVGAYPNPPAIINNSSLVVHTWGNNPAAPSRTRIDFVSGALNQSISLAVWDTESNVSITSYTSSGIPIETVTLTSVSNTLLFSTIGNSAYIIITDSNGDGHIWDNLTFTESHMPEPSTFGLFGTALAGIAILRKRSRS
jgi:hypothetical protein